MLKKVLVKVNFAEVTSMKMQLQQKWALLLTSIGDLLILKPAISIGNNPENLKHLEILI